MTREPDAEQRLLPGIHWLMVVGILCMTLGGVVTIRCITDRVEHNSAHNQAVRDLSIHVASEARTIAVSLLPAFKALHALDIAGSRHLARFELFVLDSDREPRRLAAFAALPKSGEPPVVPGLDALDEPVGVLVDITDEALETRSPNHCCSCSRIRRTCSKISGSGWTG